MATLINGDGNQAVYAAQDADMLSGAITNNKTVILDVGEKFSADVLSSSVIEVHDGVILTKEGRRIQLDQNAVDLFEFPSGAQGVVSWYYIGYKLEIDEDSHQICSTFVQKMDSEGDTIPEGSFRDGDQEVYISLYHVQQDTLGVLTPTLVLTENMTMIDVLDNLIGSASDLPDPTKTITKNIDQIKSDLSAILNVKTTWSPAVQEGNTYIGPFDKPCFVNVSGSKTSASNYANYYRFYDSDGNHEDVIIMNPSQTGIFDAEFMLGAGERATLSIFKSSATVFITK
jgi:hypothetical protein